MSSNSISTVVGLVVVGLFYFVSGPMLDKCDVGTTRTIGSPDVQYELYFHCTREEVRLSDALCVSPSNLYKVEIKALYGGYTLEGEELDDLRRPLWDAYEFMGGLDAVVGRQIVSPRNSK